MNVLQNWSKVLQQYQIFSFNITAWKVSKYGIICGPYLPAFGLNADQKWLGIWTLFTQCLLCNMRKRRKAWINSGHWKCFLYKVRAVECAIFSLSEVSPLQLYNDFCKKSHLKRTLFMKDFQASYNVLLFDKTLMYHCKLKLCNYLFTKKSR